tara:strand:- start:426 stop:956 length:531 start_codon:yes stop_codon:yes gene_type:complete
MKFFSKLNLIFIVVTIFLSGCIIQSKQLSGILELIRDPSIDLSMNSWLVRYSDYESIVYAVSTPNGTLFSNSSGDQVLFDGWVIRKVRGMGYYQVNISINDVLNDRVFKRGTMILSNHECDQWRKQESVGLVRFSQYCSNRIAYKNSILVQSNGEISVIRQIVDEKDTVLTLSKLK